MSATISMVLGFVAGVVAGSWWSHGAGPVAWAIELWRERHRPPQPPRERLALPPAAADAVTVGYAKSHAPASRDETISFRGFTLRTNQDPDRRCTHDDPEIALDHAFYEIEARLGGEPIGELAVCVQHAATSPQEATRG